jgi:hypothetical protein
MAMDAQQYKNQVILEEVGKLTAQYVDVISTLKTNHAIEVQGLRDRCAELEGLITAQNRTEGEESSA